MTGALLPGQLDGALLPGQTALLPGQLGAALLRHLEAAGVTRDGAREAARAELSRRQYRDAEPSLLLRVIGRVVREIGELFGRATLALGSGPLTAVLLALLLGALVVVVLVRLGPLRRPGHAAVLEPGAVQTAEQHRTQAELAAGQGQWAQAVRERLRAVVRELESQGVVDARPGRTAGEVARDGGAAVPALAGDLRRAAGVFDEVWYGGRQADRRSYDVLVQVDDRVRGRLVSA